MSEQEQFPKITSGFINGEWISGENRFEVRNPATAAVLGHVANLGQSEAESAVSAAEVALAPWSTTPEQARAAILRDWAQLIRANLPVLAKLTTEEQGRPLRESRQEWSSGAAALEWFAGEAERICGKSFPLSADGTFKMTLKQPVGVVAAITPWNFSVLSVLVKCGAAIAAGCTVVLKPSEHTPFAALAIAYLSQQAQLPSGVLNVIPTEQPGEVGEVLSRDPRIRLLTFTGSTVVGKRLSAQAAYTVKQVELELGGMPHLL